MRFGTWNVRNLCRSESLTSVTTELARYKLYLVGVQEISGEKASTVREGNYIFFLWTKKRKSSNCNRILVHHRVLSAFKRVAFVRDRVSYIGMRGRWCNIIVLNVHTPRGEKSDDSKDSFYKE